MPAPRWFLGRNEDGAIRYIYHDDLTDQRAKLASARLSSKVLSFRHTSISPLGMRQSFCYINTQ